MDNRHWLERREDKNYPTDGCQGCPHGLLLKQRPHGNMPLGETTSTRLARKQRRGITVPWQMVPNAADATDDGVHTAEKKPELLQTDPKL